MKSLEQLSSLYVVTNSTITNADSPTGILSKSNEGLAFRRTPSPSEIVYFETEKEAAAELKKFTQVTMGKVKQAFDVIFNGYYIVDVNKVSPTKESYFYKMFSGKNCRVYKDIDEAKWASKTIVIDEGSDGVARASRSFKSAYKHLVRITGKLEELSKTLKASGLTEKDLKALQEVALTEASAE